MQEGEELDVESDPRGGIYVVISGLIKVRDIIDAMTHHIIHVSLINNVLWWEILICEFSRYGPPLGMKREYESVLYFRDTEMTFYFMCLWRDTVL